MPPPVVPNSKCSKIIENIKSCLRSPKIIEKRENKLLSDSFLPRHKNFKDECPEENPLFSLKEIMNDEVDNQAVYKIEDKFIQIKVIHDTTLD